MISSVTMNCGTEVIGSAVVVGVVSAQMMLFVSKELVVPAMKAVELVAVPSDNAPESLVEREAETELEGDTEGEGDDEADGELDLEEDALGDTEAEADELGLVEAEADELGLPLCEALGLAEPEGELLWEPDGETEADTDAEDELEGLTESDTEAEVDELGDTEADIETEALGLADAEDDALGEILAEGETDDTPSEAVTLPNKRTKQAPVTVKIDTTPVAPLPVVPSKVNDLTAQIDQSTDVTGELSAFRCPAILFSYLFRFSIPIIAYYHTGQAILDRTFQLA